MEAMATTRAINRA